MDRSRLSGHIILAIAAMLLPACGTPAPPRCTPSTFDSLPETLEPTDVLIELKSVPSGLGSPPVGILPCDLFPTFTLLADGGAYYIDYIDGDWRQPQTMVAHLTPEEALTLVQQVLGLGFECLTSWNSQCGPSIWHGRVESVCIEDAGTSILQVRLPDGTLKAISNYGGLANDPEALEAILTRLSDYRHPEAQPYVPDTACLCFDPWLLDGDNTAVDWPQEEPWLTATGSGSWCQLNVDGSDLETLLTVTGRNRGFFKIRANGRRYGIQIVSWPTSECDTPSLCPPGIKCNTNVCRPAEAPSSP